MARYHCREPCWRPIRGRRLAWSQDTRHDVKRVGGLVCAKGALEHQGMRVVVYLDPACRGAPRAAAPDHPPGLLAPRWLSGSMPMMQPAGSTRRRIENTVIAQCRYLKNWQQTSRRKWTCCRAPYSALGRGVLLEVSIGDCRAGHSPIRNLSGGPGTIFATLEADKPSDCPPLGRAGRAISAGRHAAFNVGSYSANSSSFCLRHPRLRQRAKAYREQPKIYQ